MSYVRDPACGRSTSCSKPRIHVRFTRMANCTNVSHIRATGRTPDIFVNSYARLPKPGQLPPHPRAVSTPPLFIAIISFSPTPAVSSLNGTRTLSTSHIEHGSPYRKWVPIRVSMTRVVDDIHWKSGHEGAQSRQCRERRCARSGCELSLRKWALSSEGDAEMM